MAGETDLALMLRTLHPILDSETYVYATIPSHTGNVDMTLPDLPEGLRVRTLHLESEGWTVVVPSSELMKFPGFFVEDSEDGHDHRAQVEAGGKGGGGETGRGDSVKGKAKWQFECRLITLNIHSSLSALGLTREISRALAAKGVSANVVAGYFHDGVYVPVGMEGLAMEALEGLRRGDI